MEFPTLQRAAKYAAGNAMADTLISIAKERMLWALGECAGNAYSVRQSFAAIYASPGRKRGGQT